MYSTFCACRTMTWRMVQRLVISLESQRDDLPSNSLTIFRPLQVDLCYLCNPAYIKYTYNCTHTTTETHSPAHTQLPTTATLPTLYFSLDFTVPETTGPPHREDCVGLPNPSQTRLVAGVGRWGEGGGVRWVVVVGVQCYLAAVLLRTGRSRSINFTDITSIRGP